MPTSSGIDVGSEALKGVVLSVSSKGQAEVIAAGALPIADLGRMEDGPDKALALGTKLKELVRSARLNASVRRMGVSGSSTSIRFMPVPPVPSWRLDMLVKYEVEERSGEKEQSAFDYRILDVPEAAGQYTVMIGMLKEARAQDALTLARTAGLGEVDIDLEALALYSAYYHGHGFDVDKTVLIADIGAEDITLLICRHGVLYYAHSMIGGGRRFTQVLAEDLKVEPAEAEQLKLTQAEIAFDQPTATPANRAPLRSRGGNTQTLPRAAGASAARTPAVGGAPVRPIGLGRPGASGALPGASGARMRAPGASAKSVLPSTTPLEGGASDLSSLPSLESLESGRGPGAQSGPGAAAGSGDSPMQQGELRLVSVDISSLPPSLDQLDFSMPGHVPATPIPVAPAPAPVAPPAAKNKPAPQSDPATPVEAKDDYSLELDLPPPAAAKGPGAAAHVAPTSSEPAATLVLSPQAARDMALEVSNLTLDQRPAPAAPAPAVNVAPAAPAQVPLTPVEALDAALRTDAETTPTTEVPAPPAQVEGVDPERRRQMSAALIREAAALCAAIENKVMFCKQQTKQRELKLDRIYLTGGGSKLKGLPEFINRRMRAEVLPLEPFKLLSLNRLPVDQANALKAEQHTMAVAVGLALADHAKGTFTYNLWPNQLKQRKEFMGRGAFLLYAAGMALGTMGLFMYMPGRNTAVLHDNLEAATKAVERASTEGRELTKLQKFYEENRQRLKQIDDNVQSGHYFLNLLAELKNTGRISNDIYITQISTQIPHVVLKASGADVNNMRPAMANGRPVGTPTGTPPTPGGPPKDAPDTFLAQRRVYIRGFARGKEKATLVQPVRDFEKRLLPHPEAPDHPENLVKDVIYRYLSTDEMKDRDWFLQEFVLEVFTEGTRDQGKTVAPARSPSSPAGKPGTPAAPVAPAGTPTAPAAPVPVPAHPEGIKPQPMPPARPMAVAPQPGTVPAPATNIVPMPAPGTPAAPPNGVPAAIGARLTPPQPGTTPVQPPPGMAPAPAGAPAAGGATPPKRRVNKFVAPVTPEGAAPAPEAPKN